MKYTNFKSKSTGKKLSKTKLEVTIENVLKK